MDLFMFPRVPLSVLLFCLPFRIYVPRGNEITSFKHQVFKHKALSVISDIVIQSTYYTIILDITKDVFLNEPFSLF